MWHDALKHSFKSYLLKAYTPAHDHKLSSETFRHQVLQYAELTGDFNPVHLGDGKSAINRLFLISSDIVGD